jgi:hypothetical protein
MFNSGGSYVYYIFWYNNTKKYAGRTKHIGGPNAARGPRVEKP